MKKRFTKGEWKVREFPDGSDCFVEAPRSNKSDPYDIEILQDGHDELYPYEQKKADATLIVSAPDLLDNLERLVDRIEENNLQSHFPSAYNRAKQAIKKATK